MNPNQRDAEAIERATARIRQTVPGLVAALWQAGADQGEVESELLDAARAILLQEARALVG